MADDVKTTDIYRHNYEIQDIIISVGGQNIAIDPFRVGALTVQYDYLQRRLPVIEMDISIEDITFSLMKKNEDTLKMSIDIIEKRLDEDNNIYRIEPFMKDTYDIILSEEPVTEKDMTRNENVTENDPERRNTKLYLVKKDDVRQLDQNISTIIRNGDRASILVALFSMRGVAPKRCVITPPVNNSPVANIILPLGNVVENIDWINREYGIYSSSIMLFDDYTYIYCIDRNEPNIVMKKAGDYDTVIIFVPNTTKDLGAAMGSGDDEKSKCHLVNLASEPIVNDTRSVASETEFGTIAVVDSNGNVTKTTVDESSTKMKFVNGTNELSTEQYINMSMANPLTVTLLASYASASIFKPYKMYRFDVEDVQSTIYEQLQNKIFRLTYCGIIMMRKSDHFDTQIMLQFSVSQQ